MSMSFPLRTAVVAFVLSGLAGCSTQKNRIYEHENFDDSGTFSRNYPVVPTRRRARPHAAPCSVRVNHHQP